MDKKYRHELEEFNDNFRKAITEEIKRMESDDYEPVPFNCADAEPEEVEEYFRKRKAEDEKRNS